MNGLRKIIPLTLLLTCSFANAQYTDQINTNRPGESMGGFSVGKTVAQVETGIYGIMEKHDVLNYEDKGIGLDLTIRYGAFLEELEFIVDMQYQFDQYEDALYTINRNDFRQFTIGAKYLVYDPDKYYSPEPNLYSWKANHKFKLRNLIPAIAVYAGANLIGKDNPYTFPEDKISPKLMLITHHNFGQWVWVNNVIGDKLGTDYPSIGWITTITRGFNTDWSGFLEFQAYKSDFYADGIARVGAARLFGDNMQVDASISTNFKGTPSILYGGIGFAWRFDADYSDILLPGATEADEEKSRMDKKMEKKKEREKKRTEELESGE